MSEHISYKDIPKYGPNEELLPLADLSHEVNKESIQVENCFTYDLELGDTIKLVCADRIYYLEMDMEHDYLVMFSSKDNFDDKIQIENNFVDNQPIAAVGAEAIFQKKLSGQYFMTKQVDKIFILKPKNKLNNESSN